LIVIYIGSVLVWVFTRKYVIFTAIKSPEYYALVIRSLSALVTFLAVCVALFKEDLRKIWEYSKLEVSIPTDNFFEVLNTSSGSPSMVKPTVLEATNYSCKIQITNSGTVSALGLELSLESLVFSGPSYPAPQNIETFGLPISWDGKSDTKMNLPPEGKKLVNVLDLTGPKQQSSPGGQNMTIPSSLFIAGIKNSEDHANGKWIGTFAIFSTNSRPVRFQLEIEWNGKWQKRATEMKSSL
jgi:hypothetical protein